MTMKSFQYNTNDDENDIISSYESASDARRRRYPHHAEQESRSSHVGVSSEQSQQLHLHPNVAQTCHVIADALQTQTSYHDMKNDNVDILIEMEESFRSDNDDGSKPFTKRNSVRFQSEANTCHIPSPYESLMNDYECFHEFDQLWYTDNELEKLELDAIQNFFEFIRSKKEQRQQLCDNNNNHNTSTPASDSNLDQSHRLQVALTNQERGYEQYFCPERKRRKKKAIQLIVRAANKLFHSFQQQHHQQQQQQPSSVGNVDRNEATANPQSFPSTKEEKLAYVAKRCTWYAQQLAMEEGYRDFIRAYDSDEEKDWEVNDSASSLPGTRSSFTMKPNGTCPLSHSPLVSYDIWDYQTVTSKAPGSCKRQRSDGEQKQDCHRYRRPKSKIHRYHSV